MSRDVGGGIMELEVLALTLLAAAAFLAVPLATLWHVELATRRAVRHVEILGELSQPCCDTDVPARVNTRSPHLRLVHVARRDRDLNM